VFRQAQEAPLGYELTADAMLGTPFGNGDVAVAEISGSGYVGISHGSLTVLAPPDDSNPVYLFGFECKNADDGGLLAPAAMELKVRTGPDVTGTEVYYVEDPAVCTVGDNVCASKDDPNACLFDLHYPGQEQGDAMDPSYAAVYQAPTADGDDSDFSCDEAPPVVGDTFDDTGSCDAAVPDKASLALLPAYGDGNESDVTVECFSDDEYSSVNPNPCDAAGQEVAVALYSGPLDSVRFWFTAANSADASPPADTKTVDADTAFVWLQCDVDDGTWKTSGGSGGDLDPIAILLLRSNYQKKVTFVLDYQQVGVRVGDSSNPLLEGGRALSLPDDFGVPVSTYVVPYGAAASPTTAGQNAYAAMQAESSSAGPLLLSEAVRRARRREDNAQPISTDAKVALGITVGALVLMGVAAVLAR